MTAASASSPPDSTTRLLVRFNSGDDRARDELVARYLPILQRWGHGRLPPVGRDYSDTDDLVQITFLRALNNLDHFQAQGKTGAFFAYLRKILINAARDELRRSGRTQPRDDIDPDKLSESRSVVEDAIGRETLEHFETALEQLADQQKAAVIMRVEFGMSFPEIAAELEIPSANAARMTVSRALARVAENMP